MLLYKIGWIYASSSYSGVDWTSRNLSESEYAYVVSAMLWAMVFAAGAAFVGGMCVGLLLQGSEYGPLCGILSECGPHGGVSSAVSMDYAAIGCEERCRLIRSFVSIAQCEFSLSPDLLGLHLLTYKMSSQHPFYKNTAPYKDTYCGD